MGADLAIYIGLFVVAMLVILGAMISRVLRRCDEIEWRLDDLAPRRSSANGR